MTASVSTLREIMLDDDIPLRRRVEAAESILSFQAPAEAAEEARDFLTEVFENRNVHVDLRLDALKIIRKAEAPKVATPAAPRQEGRSGTYLVMRQRALNKLREELEARGLWPAPPGWADHILSDDWPGPPESGEQVPDNKIAETLEAARKKYLATLPSPEDSDGKP